MKALNKETRSKEQVILIKLNEVVGNLYLPSEVSDTVMIYFKGGPQFGDNGKDQLFAQVLKRYNVSLFIPDYLGYSRSDGEVFSIENCLKTINLSENFVKGESIAKNIRTKENIQVSFKKILLMGSSWSGSIIPFYRREYPTTNIEHYMLSAPVTNWKTQGKLDFEEEKIEEILTEIKNGWSHIYRNIDKSSWSEIMNGNLNKWNPIDNTEIWEGAWLYMVHGDKDSSINWSKTQEYYDTVKNVIKSGKVYFDIIKGTGHSEDTRIWGIDRAIRQFIDDQKP